VADRADTLSSARREPRGRRWDICLILFLSLFEVAWFLWYCTVPLPNAEAARTTLPSGEVSTEAIRRWHLLAEAVPYFIPGNTWSESLVGKAVDSLTRVQYLPQRVPLVLAGLLIATGATGLGLLLVRAFRSQAALGRLERLGLAFGLGLTTTSVLALGLGRAGWLFPWPIRLVLGALAVGGIACEMAHSRSSATLPGRAEQRPRHRALLLLGLLAAPFLALMVLGSLQPSIDFDALEYHLQGPKEWYQAGRISFLPHNVYTSMPFSIEMLHLLGMVVIGDWWSGALVGQFLIMLHAPMAALMIGLAASRLGGPRAGWVGAIVYLSTPWIYRLSVFSYVEGPLGYYHAALLHMSLHALSASRAVVQLWGFCGALAGGAMACKYPALVSAVLPFGFVMVFDAVRRRRLQIALAFTVGLLCSIGPWLAKNTVDHGNPVYPLGHAVFGGHPWSAERESKWARVHGPRPIDWRALTGDVLDVFGRNDWQSPLYAALAPLSLLRKGSRKAAVVLMGYCVFIVATWWLFTHRLDRFWLPVLPPLAILAGLGACWSRRRLWSGVLVAILAVGLSTNWVYDTTALAAMNRWTDDLARLRRDIPRMASPSLSWLDQTLPPEARILLVGPAGVFHMRHEVVYNTVFDEENLELIAKGQSSGQVLHSLRSRGVTHIWVDWAEIHRHRKPGGYGYSDFVHPQVLTRLVRDGVLLPMSDPFPDRDLYRVVPH
jgi:hypothetical protein